MCPVSVCVSAHQDGKLLFWANQWSQIRASQLSTGSSRSLGSSLQFHIISKCILSPPPLSPLPLRGPRRRLNVEYIFMINTFTRGYLWDSSQQPTHNFLRNLYLCQSCQFSNFPPSRSFGSGMVQAEEYASEHCAVLQIVKQISLHYDRLEPGEGMPPPRCWLTSAMTWRDMAWHVTRAQWWWWWASCTCVTSPTGPGSMSRARRRSPPSMSSAMVRQRRGNTRSS